MRVSTGPVLTFQPPDQRMFPDIRDALSHGLDRFQRYVAETDHPDRAGDTVAGAMGFGFLGTMASLLVLTSYAAVPLVPTMAFGIGAACAVGGGLYGFFHR